LIPAAHRIEQKLNTSPAENPVQWLFLDLNAFFASCEQQEDTALRGKPVIVVQTLTESITTRRRGGSIPRGHGKGQIRITVSSTRLTVTTHIQRSG
jgi:impB/mucB/samB family